jgi:hypothetical protein
MPEGVHVDAHRELFPTIRPGDTERLVHSRLIASCLRRGVNWAHGILNASTNLIPYAGESDTAFQRGGRPFRGPPSP